MHSPRHHGLLKVTIAAFALALTFFVVPFEVLVYPLTSTKTWLEAKAPPQRFTWEHLADAPEIIPKPFVILTIPPDPS
ncbi:hypothetical protein AAVH_39985, partial [Aphelenchoides avenae]